MLETLEARKLRDIFKVLKERECQLKILYHLKLYFKNEGEIKTFLKKQKLRELIATKSALQEKHHLDKPEDIRYLKSP